MKARSPFIKNCLLVELEPRRSHLHLRPKNHQREILGHTQQPDRMYLYLMLFLVTFSANQPLTAQSHPQLHQ